MAPLSSDRAAGTRADKDIDARVGSIAADRLCVTNPFRPKCGRSSGSGCVLVTFAPCAARECAQVNQPKRDPAGRADGRHGHANALPQA
jgi:hypothetical protein